MENLRIYHKKGNLNYKERRMVEALREVLPTKMEDPAFKQSFRAATNIQELKNLHDAYCIETAEFTEVKNTTIENTMAETTKDAATGDQTSGEHKINPFTEKNPKVRDYVLNGDFPGDKKKNQQQTSFGEPMTFEESFEMPDPTAEAEQNTGGQSEPKKEKPKSGPKNPPPGQQGESGPANPAFDTMTPAKQKKQTYRFAKSIVRLTCALLEKGYVWWTTKDINELKIAEYELNKEIDMSLLLELEEGQEITVRKFFENTCAEAQKDGKISEEEQEALTDALAEVFFEKGIAPTPMQCLLLTGLEILVPRVLAAVAVTSQIKQVILQLRAVTQQNAEKRAQNTYQNPSPADEEPVEEEQPPSEEQPVETEPSTELTVVE